jgi:hypothetical protein
LLVNLGEDFRLADIKNEVYIFFANGR